MAKSQSRPKTEVETERDRKTRKVLFGRSLAHQALKKKLEEMFIISPELRIQYEVELKRMVEEAQVPLEGDDNHAPSVLFTESFNDMSVQMATQVALFITILSQTGLPYETMKGLMALLDRWAVSLLQAKLTLERHNIFDRPTKED